MAAMDNHAFELKHLDGRLLYIQPPPNVQDILESGSVRCIPNEGMPISNSSKKGHLVLHFTVHMPDKLSNSQLEILRSIFPRYAKPEQSDNSYSSHMIPYDPSMDVNVKKTEDRDNDNKGQHPFSQRNVQCAQQ